MSIYDSRALLIYCCFVALVVGAVFGSFLNCVAWRIANGRSFLKGRSICPSCGHVLGAADLVPIFSWLIQKGRCRWCGARISIRYPLTELAFAILTLLCLLRFDLTVLCLRNWIFLACLFCLSLVDLEAYIIPDGCLLTALAAYVLALPFLRPGWAELGRAVLASLLFSGALLALSLLMDKLLNKESLGGGDIKLFAVIGLYLGLVGTLFTLLLSCVAGLLLGLLLRRGVGGKPIPFGPAISLAAAFVLLYGDGMINWYLGLLGL